MAEDDPFLPLAAPYALGALEAEERARFEQHLAAGCAACASELREMGEVLSALPAALPPAPTDPVLRQQVMDLSEAPPVPTDLAALDWIEVVPGVRVHLVEDDPARGVRKALVWADPGARHPLHRHGGDELILVLQGGIRDHRGEYHAGEVCRSRTGSVHTEEVLAGEACVCWVVYYGELEMLAGES